MAKSSLWALGGAVLILCVHRVVAADSVPISPAPALEETLSGLAQRIVADSLPHEFEGQKDWGRTTKVVDGLRLRDQGDGLKLRKHTTEVKNGIWKKYQAEVIDPQHQLKLRIANLHETSPGRAAMQIFFSARLHGDARVEQWKDGVKLLNATCEAESSVEARIDCEMAWHWTPGKYLGQFTVEPKVTGVDLKLTQFELKKAGKLEGWAARELGENLTGVISKKLRDEQPKLVEKLNKAIAKKQDRLHFSPDGALDNGWSKLESLLNLGEREEATEKSPEN